MGDLGAYATLPNGGTVFVALGDAIDLAREIDRLSKEEDRLQRLWLSQKTKLENTNFTSRAPAAVVEHERRRADDIGEQLRALREKLDILRGGPGLEGGVWSA